MIKLIINLIKKFRFLSANEYKPNNLGLYCQGMAYAISRDLLPKMHNNLRKVQYLWVIFTNFLYNYLKKLSKTVESNTYSNFRWMIGIQHMLY